MNAWIGYVRFRALTAQARFWPGEGDVVAGRIMVSANSAADYENQLANFATARNLELLAVEAVKPTPSKGSPELAQMAKSVNEPILVDRFCDATKPQATKITEIKRMDLIPKEGFWALLDGVAWPGLPELLSASGDEYVCLYASPDASTQAHAPWLVHLRPGSTTYNAIINRAADTHTGVFLQSRKSGVELRHHFRHYTMIKLPDEPDEPVYFRFYDPRVMLDLASALSSDTLTGFLGCCSAVYVPLSPFALLPDYASIALPITPFDEVDYCTPRIAKIVPIEHSNQSAGRKSGLTQPEYARFQSIQRRKSERMLARQLSGEFPGREYKIYRDVAHEAPKIARKFGMKSTKQVSVMARAIMTHGPSFWVGQSDVTHILNRTDILPWQKKDALVKWLVESTFEKETQL